MRSRRIARRFTDSILRTRADQKIGSRSTDTLEFGYAPLLEDECVCGEVAERLAHLDTAGLAIGFHARGGVHRVAPDVVGEPRVADDTGGGRPAVDADAQPQPPPSKRRLLADGLAHDQRQA